MTTMSIPIIAGQRPRAFDRTLIVLGTALTTWGTTRAERSTRSAQVIPDRNRAPLSPGLFDSIR